MYNVYKCLEFCTAIGYAEVTLLEFPRFVISRVAVQRMRRNTEDSKAKLEMRSIRGSSVPRHNLGTVFPDCFETSFLLTEISLFVIATFFLYGATRSLFSCGRMSHKHLRSFDAMNVQSQVMPLLVNVALLKQYYNKPTLRLTVPLSRAF